MPELLQTYVVTLKCWPNVDMFAARWGCYSAPFVAVVLSLAAQLIFLRRKKLRFYVSLQAQAVTYARKSVD